MEFSQVIVRGTAVLVVLLYGLRLAYDLNLLCPAEKRFWAARRRIEWAWLAAGIFYLIHVLAAFAFVHHWSHAEALIHTAQQTERVTGWYWGGGLWINYLIALWFPVDIIGTFRQGIDQIPRRYVVCLHLLIGFIVFNATVVFGPRYWIPIGIAFLIWVVTRKMSSGSRKE